MIVDGYSMCGFKITVVVRKVCHLKWPKEGQPINEHKFNNVQTIPTFDNIQSHCYVNLAIQL